VVKLHNEELNDLYSLPNFVRVVKLHNEKLNDLYSLPNIVGVVKSRRMRWAGHVARMGEGKGVHRVLVGKPEGRRPLGRLGGTCEYGNELSGSINEGNFLTSCKTS
jgi:hypothetical protein